VVIAALMFWAVLLGCVGLFLIIVSLVVFILLKVKKSRRIIYIIPIILVTIGLGCCIPIIKGSEVIYNNYNDKNVEKGKLYCYTESGNFKAVRKMLDSGVSPDSCPSTWKLTSLTIACRYNYIDIAKLLLDKGANVEGKSIAGPKQTPLMNAITSQNDSMVKLILESGSKVDGADNNGGPLFSSVLSRNPAIINLLLQYKSNINILDSQGNTPLINACSANSFGTANPSYIIINLLLSNNANISIKNKNNQNALQCLQENIKNNKHDPLMLTTADYDAVVKLLSEK